MKCKNIHICILNVLRISFVAEEYSYRIFDKTTRHQFVSQPAIVTTHYFETK